MGKDDPGYNVNRPDKFLTNQTVIFNKELGLRLSFIMRALDYKQVEFAELLGVSQAQVSAVFNGKATFLHKKGANEYVTSMELRSKLGQKAWRYLNNEGYAETFAPYRYETVDFLGRKAFSASKPLKKEGEK